MPNVKIDLLHEGRTNRFEVTEKDNSKLIATNFTADYLILDKDNQLVVLSALAKKEQAALLERRYRKELKSITMGTNLDSRHQKTDDDGEKFLKGSIGILEGTTAYNMISNTVEDMKHFILSTNALNQSSIVRENFNEVLEEYTLTNPDKDNTPINRSLENSDVLIDFDGNILGKFASLLKNNFSTPVLPQWIPYIYDKMMEFGLIEDLRVFNFTDKDNLVAISVRAGDIHLDQIVSNGVKSMDLEFANFENFTSSNSKLNQVSSISDYINLYSNELAQVVQNNLQIQFNPLEMRHSDAFHLSNLTANKKGVTGFYPPQANAIQGAVNTLKNENFVFIVGEMGSGKSAIGSAIPFIYSNNEISKNSEIKPFRAIVLSPNIMVNKWKREIEIRVPNVDVKIISSDQDIYDLVKENVYVNEKGKRKFKKPSRIEYYVVSTELLKPSTPQVPHFNEVGSKLNKERKDNHIHAPLTMYNPKSEYFPGAVTCPACGGVIKSAKTVQTEKFFRKWQPKKEEFLLSLRKNNMYCSHKAESKYLPKERISYWAENAFGYKVPAEAEQVCGYRFWGPKHNMSNAERKLSVAYLINKLLPRGFFKYLIADEVHELGAKSSNSANGLGQLINATEKQILLTGTLFGGMAKDIFYLLARVSAKRLKRDGMNFRNESMFNRLYGVNEKKILLDNSTDTSKTSTTAKPGINPHLFPLHLMNNTVFLELADLADALPSFDEIPVLVEPEADHLKYYATIQDKFFRYIDGHKELSGIQAFASFLNASYQLLDSPWNSKDIVLYDEDGRKHDVVKIEPYSIDYIPTKYISLKKNIQDELDKGSKSLVYTSFTGEENVQPVNKWLYDQLKKDGYNVGILTTSSSYDGIKMPKNSTDREKWIQNMMAKYNWDVLLVNPRLVKVGLDLLDFPIIHFYQVNYSTFEYMQASRRSWRIGQKKAVKVYSYIYQHTIQENVLNHLALKIDASLAIQGKFSEEGLRAMSEATGGLNEIAKDLINNKKINVDTIYDTFKRKNKSFKDLQEKEMEEYENYIMNPIEGGIEQVRKIAAEGYKDLISEIESIPVADVPERKPRKKKKPLSITKEEKQNAIDHVNDLAQKTDSYIDFIESVLVQRTSKSLKQVNTKVPKNSQATEGQFAFQF